MLENLARKLGGKRRTQLACGLALTAAGLLVIVLPTALRLRRSLAALATVRSAYASKLSWAGRKGEMEERVKNQEKVVQAIDAKLVSPDELSTLTRTIASTARAVGCSVASIRPLPSHTISRPSEANRPGPPAAKDQGPEFLEFPVRLEVEGEYRQIEALLERLAQLPTHLRVNEAVIQPSEGDRELLICELELAAFGLAKGPEKPGTPRPRRRPTPGGRS